MSVLRSEIRSGAYADSIVLMRLQSALAGLPGIEDAGVVMGTAANQELLRASNLLPEAASEAGADDLVLVVRAGDAAAGDAALGQVDALLARRAAAADDEFRPRSLESAVELLPAARWVSISVPGRFAARVARQALDLGKNVFLYSDNVPLTDEIALKTRAGEKGLLVMGPDCGTAVVGGAGLGFANRVRRGAVGLIAASGTGLQTVACRVHQLGDGISHALGTGGRDLSGDVGARSASRALELLADDPATRVIVLISKPPAAEVAARLLTAARGCGKPVVVDFLGYAPPPPAARGPIFASGLEDAAQRAVALLGEAEASAPRDSGTDGAPDAGQGRYLRALLAGGTLAYELQQALRSFLTPLHSNAPILGSLPLRDPASSQGHSIVDLGADELTVGRLHPMIDQDLRLRRLRQEAADPETGLLLLDVVLGDGAHPDPASELGPAIEEVRATRKLDVVALVIGTDEDPQDLAAQTARLTESGARVTRHPAEAAAWVVERLQPASPRESAPESSADPLAEPVAVINVGLESFYDSLQAQGTKAVHVEWRPPAGGNENLLTLLDKMRS